ncbi:type II toxin-antitoxin system RelE/ParE family toxin [Sorangium sp. So ce513]|uniref:type II toxin-antitoxin system RelE/ParE family toxin n=1 Tax=Sorangium sp. So ce513 TaxID=3133315 RepID=UPI003F5E3ABC
MKTTRLTPESEAELREAAAWYKERSPDVARRFLAEVRSLARDVARSPHRFPVLVQPDLDPPVRRALVPGFPYALVFLVTEDAVHVLAVAHQHRAPGYWLRRIRR